MLLAVAPSHIKLLSDIGYHRVHVKFEVVYCWHRTICPEHSQYCNLHTGSCIQHVLAAKCTQLSTRPKMVIMLYTRCTLLLGAEYFWVLLSGQTIASLCNVLIWGAASHLSEVWFPASERATSTAISATISPNVRRHGCSTVFWGDSIRVVYNTSLALFSTLNAGDELAHS